MHHSFIAPLKAPSTRFHVLFHSNLEQQTHNWMASQQTNKKEEENKKKTTSIGTGSAISVGNNQNHSQGELSSIQSPALNVQSTHSSLFSPSSISSSLPRVLRKRHPAAESEEEVLVAETLLSLTHAALEYRCAFCINTFYADVSALLFEKSAPVRKTAATWLKTMTAALEANERGCLPPAESRRHELMSFLSLATADADEKEDTLNSNASSLSSSSSSSSSNSSTLSDSCTCSYCRMNSHSSHTDPSERLLFGSPSPSFCSPFFCNQLPCHCFSRYFILPIDEVVEKKAEIIRGLSHQLRASPKAANSLVDSALSAPRPTLRTAQLLRHSRPHFFFPLPHEAFAFLRGVSLPQTLHALSSLTVLSSSAAQSAASVLPSCSSLHLPLKNSAVLHPLHVIADASFLLFEEKCFADEECCSAAASDASADSSLFLSFCPLNTQKITPHNEKGTGISAQKEEEEESAQEDDESEDNWKSLRFEEDGVSWRKQSLTLWRKAEKLLVTNGIISL